ncbi:YqcC family protein [uncultured Rhodospira sp.]|uniref:YqcC family protein n=1 Tax=uncultured Rhodospira sp. TaxID=1936189 RepID=UPI0026106782|nr:YqcC family protein [uncultured Rhodospira sp.]
MATEAQRAAILARLDEIEAEMNRAGLWLERLPDPPATGPLDPETGFEAWLQGVFLPNARRAAESDTLPSRSQVGVMAQRQYDYHSIVPEALRLVELLHDFDRMVEAAARRRR